MRGRGRSAGFGTRRMRELRVMRRRRFSQTYNICIVPSPKNLAGILTWGVQVTADAECEN